MANYNYGITCENSDIAEGVKEYIAGLDIYQDGLDCQDDRVSLISKSSLGAQLQSYAKSKKVALNVEIWPSDMEYDDAEAQGEIEVKSFTGKTAKKPSGNKAPIRMKAYAGTKDPRDLFKRWIEQGHIAGATLLGEWDAQAEYGSWGVELQLDDPALKKIIDAEWGGKGIVTEKVK